MAIIRIHYIHTIFILTIFTCCVTSIILKRRIYMYTPRHFKVTDMNEIWDFVQENSFGTIVTNDGGKPIATHLPFLLHKKDDDYYLTSHFAYGNPQWKTLEQHDDVLVIFQGPHA